MKGHKKNTVYRSKPVAKKPWAYKTPLGRHRYFDTEAEAVQAQKDWAPYLRSMVRDNAVPIGSRVFAYGILYEIKGLSKNSLKVKLVGLSKELSLTKHHLIGKTYNALTDLSTAVHGTERDLAKPSSELMKLGEKKATRMDAARKSYRDELWKKYPPAQSTTVHAQQPSLFDQIDTSLVEDEARNGFSPINDVKILCEAFEETSVSLSDPARAKILAEFFVQVGKGLESAHMVSTKKTLTNNNIFDILNQNKQ